MAFLAVDWSDVIVRAAKTFVQAAAAFASTALATGEIVYGVGESLGLSVLAAGISAAWNGVLAPAIKAVWAEIDALVNRHG